VDLQAISLISERVSRRLDLEGFDPGPYSLEVSSPGVERPLRRPEDFARRIGERVKVKTHGPIDGSHVHEGPIAAADEDAVTVATDNGERRVRYDEISSARTVFVWGAEGGRRRR
jgi:ribosome maturation factor RimP